MPGGLKLRKLYEGDDKDDDGDNVTDK